MKLQMDWVNAEWDSMLTESMWNERIFEYHGEFEAKIENTSKPYSRIIEIWMYWRIL